MKKRIIKTKQKELYCLFSVDLANSTSNKYTDPHWDNLILNFYEKIPLHFQTILSSKGVSNTIEIWKYVGDEILFYSKITDILQIPLTVSAFKETLEFFLNNQDRIAIKGTIWTAQLNRIDKSFYANRSSNNNNNNLDFIGPSIDCGFRISKFATQQYIAISVEVADLCKDSPYLLEAMYFNNSEFLKGVNHNDRAYPIFLIKLDSNKQIIEDIYLRKSCDLQLLNTFMTEYYNEANIIKYNWCITRITQDFFDNNDSQNSFGNKRGTRSFSQDSSQNIQIIKNWFYEHFQDPSDVCIYDVKKGDYVYSNIEEYQNGFDCSKEIRNKFSNSFTENELDIAINEILTETSCYIWAKKDA